MLRVSIPPRCLHVRFWVMKPPGGRVDWPHSVTRLGRAVVSRVGSCWRCLGSFWLLWEGHHGPLEVVILIMFGDRYDPLGVVILTLFLRSS